MRGGWSLSALRAHLSVPLDPASFVCFRVGFGLLASAAAVRFVAKGWVDALLLQPSFHFAWWPGLPVPPAAVLYALFAVQALAGLAIAAGRLTRPALVAWLLSFGYVELLDKALYLNHYVLFSLLGLWLVVAPVDRIGRHGGGVPRWVLWLLRVQVGSVYVWAGIAKLNADWLLRAEPLNTWLAARAYVPLVGPLLCHPATAFAMSWAGAAFDLCVVPALAYPRTRPLAFACVLAFHTSVGLLFPIGVFPWLMVLAATLWLDPGWPRRFGMGAWLAQSVERPAILGRAGLAAWVTLSLAIALSPARHLLLGPDVNWSERGFRFAWRVMLIEKTGMVDFRVHERSTGRTWRVMPSVELSELQHKQMRTQPDMIRDYALHLRAVHAKQGRQVAVYADAWASLHGRPVQRLLRPDVDLTAPLSALERDGWIMPLR